MSLVIDVLAAVTFASAALADRAPEPPRPERAAWLCSVGHEICDKARDKAVAGAPTLPDPITIDRS